MVKFFKTEDYLRQFQSGLLYSKTFEYFRKLEDDNGTRCDLLEGLVKQTDISNGAFWLKPANEPNAAWKKLPFLDALFSQFHQGNIFCMSRFRLTPNTEIQDFIIDERFDQFGDYYSVILNQVEFEQRLRKAIKKANLIVSGRMVDYLDLSRFNEKRSAFMKDNRFAWQHEYRYHFQTDLKTPLKLNIGNIKDITMTGVLSKNRTYQYKVRNVMR